MQGKGIKTCCLMSLIRVGVTCSSEDSEEKGSKSDREEVTATKRRGSGLTDGTMD